MKGDLIVDYSAAKYTKVPNNRPDKTSNGIQV